MDTHGICSSITAEGYTLKFRGVSAIDRYMGLPALPFSWIETNADIAVLARHAENLRFPGVEVADGAVDTSDGICYFRCLDNSDYSLYEQEQHSFPLLSFTYDWQTRRFQDPKGVYLLLRELRDKRDYYIDPGTLYPKAVPPMPGRHEEGCGRSSTIMDAALLLARYGLTSEIPGNFLPESPPEVETQRVFLSCLMVSPRPDWGLELLKRTGLLKDLWPELASYDDVDHAKEFHPEGNVWNHTLETFRHRKFPASGAFDLRLSLGLLLHDAGKPIAVTNRSRRFDGHAELGARAAARFLDRLEFDPPIVQDVYYLVRNHMLPAALKRLPVTKTAEIMASPMFPTLMELYRCDEASSFKGLDGYYENSAAYQAYLRNVRNPYRSLDGKKIGRREIYSKL